MTVFPGAILDYQDTVYAGTGTWQLTYNTVRILGLLNPEAEAQFIQDVFITGHTVPSTMDDWRIL